MVSNGSAKRVATHIVRVALWTFLVVLIDAAANFKATLENLPALHVVVFLLVQRDWNLLVERFSNHPWSEYKPNTLVYAINVATSNTLPQTSCLRKKLTLRHSMAVPAWCWNAIFAILLGSGWVFLCGGLGDYGGRNRWRFRKWAGPMLLYCLYSLVALNRN